MWCFCVVKVMLFAFSFHDLDHHYHHQSILFRNETEKRSPTILFIILFLWESVYQRHCYHHCQLPLLSHITIIITALQYMQHCSVISWKCSSNHLSWFQSSICRSFVVVWWSDDRVSGVGADKKYMVVCLY